MTQAEATDTPFSKLVQIAEDLWYVKSMFPLGEAQTTGMNWKCTRNRLLGLLGTDPLEHPALTPGFHQQSTETELFEEVENMKTVLVGDYVPFPMDTTMVVMRWKQSDGERVLLLRSPVPMNDEVAKAIDELGKVTAVVAASYEHSVFLEEWMHRYPFAKLYVSGDGQSDGIEEKLPSSIVPSRIEHIQEGNGQFHPSIHVRMLEGAPRKLSEMMFFHKPSNTLIVDDAFSPGYAAGDFASWFVRLWLKLTRNTGFRRVCLPSYQMSRTIAFGNPDKLLRTVDEICVKWDIRRIICAHGTVPYERDAANVFRASWYALREL